MLCKRTKAIAFEKVPLHKLRHDYTAITLVVLPSSRPLLLDIISQQTNHRTSITTTQPILPSRTLVITVLQPDPPSLITSILTTQPEIIKLGHLIQTRDLKTRECGIGGCICRVRLRVRQQAIGTNVDLLATGDLGVEVEQAVS